MKTPQVVTFGLDILERVVQAVEAVRERMLRATAVLDKAGLAYAVVGGNAVAAWVATKNKRAVRFTQDVDLLLRRSDMDAATAALATAGFVRNETLGVEMFLDGPDATPVDAVHILFAGEKVVKGDLVAAPDVGDVATDVGEAYRVLDLEPLVQMKLTSYRRKDQVHIQDMIRVGLIDSSWLSRFPPELAARLQPLLDDPNG
jgi:hypothetical protein